MLCDFGKRHIRPFWQKNFVSARYFSCRTMPRKPGLRYMPYQRKSVRAMPSSGEYSGGNGSSSRATDDSLNGRCVSVKSAEDLGSLSQTCLNLRDSVLAFVASSDFSRKMSNMLTETVGYPMRSVYRRVGNVLKRATCIMPTAKRLKVAEQFYALNGPPDLVSGEALAGCWGVLIKQFVNGWEYNECERVFKAICQFGTRDEVNRLTNEFLTSEPGSNRETEKRLRRFLRAVFLEPHMTPSATKPLDNDFGFYLDLILREHSMYYQAKLIYLLFGPENDGGLQWDLMGCQSVQISSIYHEMGSAICALSHVVLDSKRSRTAPQLVSLIEEVTSFPENWTLHNFSYLLDNCGENILNMVLSSRIINGRMKEACEIFACLTLISAHNELPMINRMRLFIKILNNLKSKADQMTLINELVKTHYRRLGQIMASFFPAIPWQEELSATELFYGEALRMAFRRISMNSEV